MKQAIFMNLNKFIIIIICIFIFFRIIKEFNLSPSQRTNPYIILFIFICLFLTYFLGLFMLGLLGLIPLLNSLISKCKK